MADKDDYEMILMLSAGCSLDSSPKKNWVEKSGGLPNYICKIAKAVMRSGKTKSAAIAIAVSRVKKWAAGGGDVDADTKAKAAKALAQWEALKVKNKKNQVVAASYVTSDGEEDTYLMLSYIPSFKTDIVRIAWSARESQARKQWNETHRSESAYGNETVAASDYYPYRYIKELWTDFILVENEDAGDGPALAKIPYTVHPLTKEVEFGEEVEVRQVYVEVDETLSETEKGLLLDLLGD
jgi:hypothetical protein